MKPATPMRATTPSSTALQFSLFEGDGLSRLYARLHLSNHSRHRLLKRCLLVVLITWVPVALLAWEGGYVGLSLTAQNFFADFAAYAQFLLAMPLFVLAQPIIDGNTRNAAAQFVNCGIVREEYLPRLIAINESVTTLRTSWYPDVGCIVLSYVLSLVILVPEFAPGAKPTWHVQTWSFGPGPTLAG